MSEEWRRLPGLISGIVAIATLPTGILVGLFAGFEAAVIVFVVGWLLLVPLIPIVGEELLPLIDDRLRSEGEPVATSNDSLSELKERYARGEIGDEEFERQVDRVLASDGHAAETVSEPEPREPNQSVEHEEG